VGEFVAHGDALALMFNVEWEMENLPKTNPASAGAGRVVTPRRGKSRVPRWFCRIGVSSLRRKHDVAPGRGVKGFCGETLDEVGKLLSRS
jgi:hypothetical protein